MIANLIFHIFPKNCVQLEVTIRSVPFIPSAENDYDNSFISTHPRCSALNVIVLRSIKLFNKIEHKTSDIAKEYMAFNMSMYFLDREKYIVSIFKI